MRPLPRPVAPQTRMSEIARRIGGIAQGEAVVTGVVSDNRIARAGDLFAAVPGEHVHGASFVGAALAAGATAILTDPAGLATVKDAGLECPAILVDDVAHSLGAAAAELYGNPARRLRTFAVTGTNGKTTTAFMVENALALLGARTGLIGTIELRLAGHSIPAELTTPMPADLQGVLAALVEAGGTDLVMEASSHALAQGRTDPIRYDVAGFTNFTQDHLDFHSTMKEYFEAKALLLTPEKCRHGVVIVDDEPGRAMHDRAVEALGKDNARALAVFSDLAGRDGWQVRDIEHEGSGSRFVLEDGATGSAVALRTRLPGDFNVANAALAAAMLLAGGVGSQALATLGDISPTVPGRMELVSERPRVIVDFAHNTDALVKAMTTLRESTEGRLVTLTGAAGERDQDKRAAMGEAVARYSDDVIITDDDPHEEDPATIRAAVLAGTEGLGTPVREIPDRCDAIDAAIMGAADGDTVLLAGRGHETHQPVAGGRLVPLDDRVEARKALSRREQTR